MTRARTVSARLQPRDILVLRGLFDARAMTLRHIAALHFEGRSDAAKKRLQKLKRAGWVRERSRPRNEPGVLHLTAAGLETLCASDDTVTYDSSPRLLARRMRVTDHTLRHELAVMDVKIAIIVGVRERPGLSIVEFSTWPADNAFQAVQPAMPGAPSKLATVRPDAYVHIRDGEDNDYRFFLEVDRSTETLDTIAQKAACYRSFYQRGGFAERCGGRSAAVEDFPFVVLVVVKSVERRDNIARRLLEIVPPVLSQVWIGTMQMLTADPLGRVWLQPLALRRHGASGVPSLAALLD